MLFRSLLAFLLLIGWPFAATVPASSRVQGGGPEVNHPISLWIDPRPLAPVPPADAAPESQLFEQTLLRTIEFFLPISDAGKATVGQAAAAFSARKPLVLNIARFDSDSPVIEFDADASQPAGAANLAHRQWASTQRGADAGSPVFELFVDVDALRHTFESSFAARRAGRVIHALNVPNARSLMLHGRWIAPDKVPLVDPALPLAPSARRIGEYAAQGGPPILRLDLSWNSRSDPPATIRGLNIAAGHWPKAQLKMDPSPAPFLCVFRAGFRDWFQRALLLRSAWLDPAESQEFQQACDLWLRTNGVTITRISGAAALFLLVYPDPDRADTLIAAASPRPDGLKADVIATELDQLLRRQFNKGIGNVPDGDSILSTPAFWPFREIAWNPSPRPPRSTVEFHFRLRGGQLDPAGEPR